MAESTSKIVEPNKETGNSLECAICLQACIHPAQLPCGHIFCFLCVKGIANHSKRCAMCRQEIPRDFLDHPKLLENPTDLKEVCEAFEGGYQWFYEGRNGWWQYDERTSRELEASYKSGERTCELLIAGFLFVADFDSMIQRRRNDPARRRRIKRDLSSIPKKGIAGIKLAEESTNTDRSESPSNVCPTPPVTPAERPHSPTTVDEIIERVRAIALDNNARDEDYLYVLRLL